MVRGRNRIAFEFLWIVGLFPVFLFCRPLSSQAQPRIAVTVTDTSGARVPGTIIETRCSSSAKASTEVKADAAGEAVVNIQPGECTILARASGFRTWSLKVDRQEKSRSVTAVLRIAESGNAFPVNSSELIEPEVETVEASISLEKLDLLTDLPQHKLGRRFRHKISSRSARDDAG